MEKDKKKVDQSEIDFPIDKDERVYITAKGLIAMIEYETQAMMRETEIIRKLLQKTDHGRQISTAALLFAVAAFILSLIRLIGII